MEQTKNEKEYMYTLGAIVLSLACLVFFGGSASAISRNVAPFGKIKDDMLDKFSASNIMFYDPCGNESSASSCAWSGEEITWNELNQIADGDTATAIKLLASTYGELAMSLQEEYGVPWELVFIQMGNESGGGVNRSHSVAINIRDKDGKYNLLGMDIPKNRAKNPWASESTYPYTDGMNGSSHEAAEYDTLSAMIIGFVIAYYRNGLYANGLEYWGGSNFDFWTGFANASCTYVGTATACASGASYSGSAGEWFYKKVHEAAEEKGWPTSEELAKQKNIPAGGNWPDLAKDIREEAWEKYGTTGLPCSGDGGTSANKLPGDTNEEKIWNAIVDLGVEGVSNNAEVISGILGNLMQESGYNPFSGSSSYCGLFQTSCTKLKPVVDAAVGNSSYWGTNSAPDDAVEKAIIAEIDYLKDESDFNNFVANLDIVANKTPEAYADLFLAAYEIAYTDKATSQYAQHDNSNSLADSGVASWAQKRYPNVSGGGKYFQEAGERRYYAKDVFTRLAESAGSSQQPSPSSKAIEKTAVTKSTKTATKLIEYAKEVGKYITDNNFTYGDASKNPAVDSSEKKVSCDRFVGWVLYKLGFTDQPESHGLTVSTSHNADNEMEKYLKKNGFSEIDSKDKLQAGDIVISNEHNHVFIVGDKVSDGVWERYDAGSQDRIDSKTGLYFKEAINDFTVAYRLPSNGGKLIAEKAKELAWPLGSPKGGSYEGTQAYNDAAKALGNAFTSAGSDDESGCRISDATGICYSCARFVSVTLYESGADSDFIEATKAKGNNPHLIGETEGYIPYYFINSENWSEVTDYDGVGYDKLLPGDILIWDEALWGSGPFPYHTFIYVGDGIVAEASNSDFAPYLHEWANDGYKAFRINTSVEEKESKSGCGGGSYDGVPKNIEDAVKKYVWPQWNGTRKDARPDYQELVNSGKYYNGGGPTDCNGFVTKMIIVTNIDSNYNAGNEATAGVVNSIQSTSGWGANWETIYKPGDAIDTSKLIPGDVFLKSGHTFLYVGKISGYDCDLASASLGDHVPVSCNGGINAADYSGGQYYVFRKKK